MRAGLCDLQRDTLYWHFPNYIGAGHPDPATPLSAIRFNQWKLIHFYEDNRIELYNLDDDPGEITNLAREHPKQVASLHAKLAAWLHETNARRQMGERAAPHAGAVAVRLEDEDEDREMRRATLGRMRWLRRCGLGLATCNLS